MRWRIAIAIFRKELLETLRDRRTLLVMLLLPIVLYPLLIIAFGQVVTHQVSQLQAQEVRVWVLGPLPKPLRERLKAAEGLEPFRVERAPPVPASLPYIEPEASDDDADAPARAYPSTKVPEEVEAWARRAINRNRTDAVLVLPADIARVLAREGTAPIAILYDETVQESRSARDRLETILYDWRDELRKERLANRPELPAGFLRPVLIDASNTATAQKRGGFLAGRIIPLVLMVMVMLGAFYPAIDLTAGEKERGTMQTLLTAPARATEIIVGKFIAVFAVAMVSALANLVSMALAIGWMLQNTPHGGQFVFHIDIMTVLLVLIQLIPIAVFFSALMLAIAVFAQSFKEAQNYLTPVYILVIVPAAIAALPTVTLNATTAWAPGLNIMLLLREVLMEPPAAWLVIMVLVANTLYAAGALALAVCIFQNEQVLLGGQAPVGTVLNLRDDRDGRPRPLLSLLAFGILLVLLYYVGQWMQQTDIFWGMLGTQWLLILLPVIVIVRTLRLDPVATLSLRPPNLRMFVASLLLGLSAWAVLGHFATAIQNLVLPTPPALEEMMREALGLDDASLADWRLILAFCLSPAICEELFFRGLIMGSFRGRLRKWSTITLAAVLFGAFHLSIYRIFPTAVLGFLIAWIVFQSGSIYTGIILHFLNNFIAVMAMKYGWLPGLTGAGDDGLHWGMMSVVIVIFLVGLALALKPVHVDEAGDPEPPPAPPPQPLDSAPSSSAN